MSGGFLEEPGAVILVVVAGGLGLVSLILLFEWARAFRKQRAARKQLKGIDRRTVAAQNDPTSVLYREEGSGLAPWLEPIVARLPQLRDVEHLLSQADMTLSVGTFLLISVGLGVTFALIAVTITRGWPVAVGAGLFGAVIPFLYVRRRRTKRIRAFEEHFPEAIDLLGRSIRAGHAFSTGLKIVSEESPDPISTEFKQVFEEQKFGLPLEDSLMSLADRIPLVDIRILVTAILVQRDVGGNLAEILDKISYTIRERFMILRQVRVHTAQGRMTGYLLAGLPIFVGSLVFFLNPDYIGILLEHPLGKVLLGAAATMQFTGFLLIRKIIEIEV